MMAISPEKDFWYSFLLQADKPRAIERLKGLGKFKIPETLLGIEPTNFPAIA
jgi:hypothetical protein